MITEGFNGFYEYAQFSIAEDLRFTWDKHDNVWVYCSDTGTFYYTKISDEQWEKHSFNGDVYSYDVPDEIRKVILDHE